MDHWLLERLLRFPEGDAIVYRDQPMRYADLCVRVGEWFRVLEKSGIRQGSVVGIRGEYSPAVCALFLALVFSRNIVVPMPTKDEGSRRYVDLAGAQSLFEFGASDQWSLSSFAAAAPPPLIQQLQQQDAAGLVIFTSGSTGECKAGLFDFETLVKRYREPRRRYRTLVFLLLDHLGGIHTMLHTLAHGGTLVLTEDRRPESVCRAVERHRVELLPTTPTFLRMLAISGVHERYDLSSLRLITYGTEPMAPSTLRALAGLFPNVSFKQTYGLSELGVLPTRSKASDSLWLEVGGVGCESRVVDNVLWIRSETAMLGYLNAPSPFDEDGWYNTHDAVEVSGPYVRILGRTSDLINVGGQKVYPSEVENVLLEMDNVSEVTVWGQANPVTGQVVAARVTLARLEDHESLDRRVHQFCHERLATHKIPVYLEIVDGGHHGQRFKKVRPSAPEPYGSETTPA